MVIDVCNAKYPFEKLDQSKFSHHNQLGSTRPAATGQEGRHHI